MLHAVVMAGGSGTRFWPMSRAARPKQLLALATANALIAETVARLEGLVALDNVHVVTNAAYAAQTSALLPGVPVRNIIAEPVGRDTAACIGLASALIHEKDPAAVMVVLPADHVVDPPAAFRTALARAAKAVEKRRDVLVTFGIPPAFPATGYGYIERGAAFGKVDKTPYYKVDSFREKPDEETARLFLAEGRFLWNAGIFVFRAAAMLDRLARYLPQIAERLPALRDQWLAKGAIEAADYEVLTRISIDYGVLEKDGDVAVMEAPFHWDDIGSFAALERVLPKDEVGNCCVGTVHALAAHDNVAVADGDHLLALLGVNGLIVVHTPDATLVCRKEDAERVKDLVNHMKARGETRL